MSVSYILMKISARQNWDHDHRVSLLEDYINEQHTDGEFIEFLESNMTEYDGDIEINGIEDVANLRNWGTLEVLGCLMEYIEGQHDNESFRVFLEKAADLENSYPSNEPTTFGV